MLKEKRQEVEQREQEVMERFNYVEKERFEAEKRLMKLLEDRATAVN